MLVFSARVSGIIGPNGAGKTTVMNALSGFVPCSGTVKHGDTEISKLAAHKRARWGLRRSFQKSQIATDLTVLENLQVILDGLPMGKGDKQHDLERALEITGLDVHANTLAAELNTFERRLADVARCLVGNPKIVMFDEPGGGLGREETDRIGDLIQSVPEHTTAQVLMIDHNVDLVSRICTETLVLDFGKRIAFGPTKEVLKTREVQAAYLGIDEGVG